MRIEIEIPKEFEEHFMQDKFEDTLHRLSADAHLIAGNYEQETAIMLIKAFKESKTAYDVDKVVERLEELREEILSDTAYDNDTVNYYLGYADLMIEVVKSGGTE